VQRHLAILPDPRPSSARGGRLHCRLGSLGFRPVRRMDQVPAIEWSARWIPRNQAALRRWNPCAEPSTHL